MEFETPFNFVELKFQRHYPGYIYRREIIDDSEYGGDGKLEMVNCYSAENGFYMGDARMARFLCKKHGIRQVQKAHSNHIICSIGFNPQEKKWYGWSHRAIAGFGIGDKVFDENFGDDETPFIHHGENEIVNLEDAKQAAINFAQYVS